MSKEKLTSVKLQMMINTKMPEKDLWCPYLNFGRKKSGRYAFPIVFDDRRPASRLCGELQKLIGKSLEEVKEEGDKLFEKYKKYEYNQPTTIHD